MKSLNFEFLRAKRAPLADLGAFAEQYARTDPASSLVKQRIFLEFAVMDLYDYYGLVEPTSDEISLYLKNSEFEKLVPETTLNKLHTIRKTGNKGAHSGKPIKDTDALQCLYTTFEIAQWFHITVDNGKVSDFPTYTTPQVVKQDSAEAKAALAKLQTLEQQHNQVLEKLEQEHKQLIEKDKVVSQTSAELAALKLKGEQAAKRSRSTKKPRVELNRLYAQAAGWDVGDFGKSTEQVKQELKVSYMPTASGEGFADYVLFGDNGKPLAVIEAKRTAKDPVEGAEQARIYAMCLEKMFGQYPVVFYTNGRDVYIWDDQQKLPKRKIYGFYSKDSLEYLVSQRQSKVPLAAVAPNPEIAGRLYQIEAIKRVCDRFSENYRKALLVQATGTGKTRVAVSLCELLMRAGWAKRILFLCDRRELRKQALKVFTDFLPGEPRIVIDSDTSWNRTDRIYLATYPAMMKCFDTFDVGFFDLVIADESHRSIYKKYRSLFLYFDALQIGLTATPIDNIDRNTYELFQCKDKDPTSNYDLIQAINEKPPHLVPFYVTEIKTKISEHGLKYSQMTMKERAQLEEQENDPNSVEYTPEEINQMFFNKDTTRKILSVFDDQGIRDADHQQIGKTIIFARNHDHAIHIQDVFIEEYPKLSSEFCRVIDSHEPRADQLLDDFKDKEKDPTIAISVDMLDTGIDVPEIVNLVFAKRVRSYVKFWQMIGRGTRLCKNLFGPGKDKTEFRIFDCGGNFAFFDIEHNKPNSKPQKALLQQLFEARIDIADTAITKLNEAVFQPCVDLILDDIQAVKDSKAIEVRDQWRALELLSDRPRVAAWSANTKSDLLSIAAPLMQWRDIRGSEPAYRFDLMVTRLELALLKGGPSSQRVADYRHAIQAHVDLLAKNTNQVKAKSSVILKVESKDFWLNVTFEQLEEVRRELREIMQYQQEEKLGKIAPRVYDIEDANLAVTSYTPKLEGLELVEYKNRVESVLRQHFADNTVLVRLRSQQSVSENELEDLAKLVLQIDDKANVKYLIGAQPQVRQNLLAVFRSLVGLDAEAVNKQFEGFAHKHKLSAQQLRFLQMLKNHIAKNGGIELERLYADPFTKVHADSLDGIFSEQQVKELYQNYRDV